MPYATSQGRQIHYLDQGEGPPIVLLHSGGLSSRQWTRLIPRLPQGHRTIALDFLGSGASDPVPADQPFDFMQDVDALEAVLQSIDGRIHFVGHSYGGLVALTWARKHPERVRSLSLFEPVAFGVLWSRNDEAGIRDLEDYDREGTFFDDASGGGEAWMERFIDWWQGQGAWRSLPDASRAAFLKVGRKVFQEVRSLLHDRTSHEAYRSIDAPALLMTGLRSPLAARRVCAILAETFAKGTLASYEGAGHMAPLTHAHLVSESISSHIAASP